MVRPLGPERDEVVSIARDEDESVLNGVIQDCRVGCVAGKHLAQKRHAMPDVLQQMAQVVGDVVIEQEGHESAGDICRATSTSISPR